MENSSTSWNLLSSYSLAFFLSLVTCLGCVHSAKEDIVINGDFVSTTSFLEGKKLYLQNAGSRSFIDSTVVKEGKFRFEIQPVAEFSSIPCSFVYETANPRAPYQRLPIKNPYLNKTVESNFILTRGNFNFVADPAFKPRGDEKVGFLFENPNLETEVAYRHLSFKSGPALSDKDRAYNRALIKKYATSSELLRQLNWTKSSLSDHELAALLPLFDPALQSTREYANIKSYLAVENKTGNLFPADILLKKPDKSFTSAVLNGSGKHNLVVFWASWCGPCRQEIPQIKKLESQFKDKLNIVSISIDHDETAWQKALEKEKMPWSQFLALADSSRIKLDKKYNLQSIPVWVLLDSDNKLVERQVGYDTGKNSIDRKVAAQLAKL
ncbi:TlpA disulfide reductase family protein [Dyadobacter crusticola]|uniref:TlpA disulfide reductase family protein n=1 Tax=Dyadobacter crusticola TaxID=292407 RepID=UPI0004E27C41|nr:TlpA disulfide reductase family protein [Dyadobacter crusticola]